MTKMRSRSRPERSISGGMPALVMFGLLAFHGQALGQASADDTVTFAKDVAPILQENCQICHRPGTIGPMSLLTYEQVRPWAPMIKDRVETRLMPPWPLDRTVGIQEFKNDPSLSDEDIATIVRWADAGAPMGDPADMPPPIEWPDHSETWQLEGEFGPPDLVVTTEDYTAPAVSLDQWPFSEVPIEGITEERWIRAVEIRPSSPGAAYVFHHGNSILVQSNQAGESEGTGLVAAAVGKMYDILPPDTGIKLLPGARVRTGLHYFSVGEEVQGATLDIGIYLYPPGETPRFETPGSGIARADASDTSTRGAWTKISTMPTGGLGRSDIFIPPHGTQILRGTWVVQEPTRIHSIRGHMHLRGKYQVIEAVYPDGRHEVLNKLDWQHRWHTAFQYEDHVMPLLPKGTVVIITSYFDNTTNNPGNPDPDQLVVFGQRSVDEMSHMWIGWTFFNEEEFEELVAEQELLQRQKEHAQATTDN